MGWRLVAEGVLHASGGLFVLTALSLGLPQIEQSLVVHMLGQG
ncbi:hypothetical protein BOSEA31B_14283 [Hyphomicrobiales bacterium]|nr:hypothetical protein BOSEA31B_14283 [Hyphomicrobiales bacterium]CAH1700062.1 hypothetical protein BOSEA1005_13115 [Hyphomicrobiales bacterium]CAI0343823.1 hypothetical protein BO1005MUT1_300019 [Hyphomicrobiales bacterium]